MEMGRETKKIPYGDSPFPNRVCSNLGTNIYVCPLISDYVSPYGENGPGGVTRPPPLFEPCS